MTIISLAVAILKVINQVIAQGQQILAAQQQQAVQIVALRDATQALAETQEKQGIILEKILAAVQSGPVGVTARIVLDTPIPQ